MDEERYQALAHHEAGHAVAAELLGAQFKNVFPHKYSPAGWNIEYGGGLESLTRDERVIVNLAGEVAAGLFGYSAPMGEDDRRNIEAAIGKSLDSASAYVDAKRAEVEQLLDSTQGREAIAGLAAELCRRVSGPPPRRIPYHEAIEIIRRSDPQA